MDEQKPGVVIAPGQSSETPNTVATPPQAPTAPVAPSDSPESPIALSAEDAAKYQTPAAFNQDASGLDTENPEDTISWSASEYISHHKSSGWYAAFGVITLFALIGIYFFTGRDILSVGVVGVVAVVFVMYAGRQPKEQLYSISDHGIAVGAKTYSFQDFKSFSVIDEGAFSSIAFMPLKRFMPIISIYYAPDDEDKIVDALSIHLPFDERQADPIDRFMKKIRF